MVTRQQLTAAVLALGVVLGFTACARSLGPGSLQYQDEGTEWCAPAATRRDYVLTLHSDLTGSEAVTLTSVTPVETDKMRVLGSWAVPIDREKDEGTNEWPISAKEYPWWANREPVKGTELKPEGHYDILLHLRLASGTAGRLGDVRVNYQQGSDARTADAFTAVRIAKSC